MFHISQLICLERICRNSNKSDIISHWELHPSPGITSIFLLSLVLGSPPWGLEVHLHSKPSQLSPTLSWAFSCLWPLPRNPGFSAQEGLVGCNKSYLGWRVASLSHGGVLILTWYLSCQFLALGHFLKFIYRHFAACVADGFVIFCCCFMAFWVCACPPQAAAVSQELLSFVSYFMGKNWKAFS